MTNTFIQAKEEVLKTFSVKGYKVWQGREGVGAEATLYKNKKRLECWVIDHGDGGGPWIRAKNEDLKMITGFLKTLPAYNFNDYWLDQYSESWDGENKLESWTLSMFCDVMLRAAEDRILKRNKKND